RRYPLVEASCGALGAGLSLRWPGDPLWTALALVAAGLLLAVALIDWDTFLIPNSLSLGLLTAGLLIAPFNPLFEGGLGWRWLHSLGGAAAGFFGCWAIAELGERIFKKEAMGGGDVKLLAAVGAWSGVLGAFDCMVVGSALGAVYGVGLLILGRIRRQDPIPFGPFLSAGAVFNFFFLLPFGFPFP
ncbi:MAG: A24 family peptidase, partial [Elusimicrobiota bacterium]